MLIQMTTIGREYRKGSVTISALQSVNLAITEGEFTAIMGPSGSGKSTLLHILGCLDCPSQGNYYLEEINVSGLNDSQLSQIRNQKIGFIFQSFNLLPQHTVLQNIETPLLYSSNMSQENSWQGFRVTENKRNVWAQNIAEQVGLGKRLHHRPSELSAILNRYPSRD